MLNIIASSLLTIAILIAGFNTATMDSLKYLTSEYWSGDLGSFTQLTSTDKMSAFPTTYNANLAKTIEVGTTTIPSVTTLSALSSIGTITNGVWNATAIPVNKGGTGTTSPSTYMVMLGNGANGLTMASTTGTTGQFLTSAGAGAYPTWTTSSIDEGLDYTFTGNNTFTGDTTLASTSATSFTSATTTTTNLVVLGGNISGLSTSTLYTATGSHTWTKPYGAKKVFVELWGAGASGARADNSTNDAGGGGGGEYAYFIYDGTQIPSTATIIIGTGGAGVSSANTSGNAGGNTSFGGIATSTGGTGGNVAAGSTGGTGGSPTIGVTGLWGLGVAGATGSYGIYSGSGGGCASGGVTTCNTGNGGGSRFGGAGGGGADSDSVGTGGVSIFGGNGGAGSALGTGTAGSNPGGGGGASDQGTSGAGGNGQSRVTVFY